MERQGFFREALASCEQLTTRYPSSRRLHSIIGQLQYLLALEDGRSSDQSVLAGINIGFCAGDEIEHLAAHIADLAHAASSQARRARAC